MPDYTLQHTGENIDKRLQNVIRNKVIRVAQGGDGDYSTMSEAISAQTDEIIEWYPGTYEENLTINKSLIIRCISVGGNSVILQPSSGVAITFASGSYDVTIADLKIVTPTTLNTDKAIDWNGGNVFFRRSEIRVAPTTTYHTLVNAAGSGNLIMNDFNFVYPHTGTTIGANIHKCIDYTGSGLISLNEVAFNITNSNDNDDDYCGIDIDSTASGSMIVLGCFFGIHNLNNSYTGNMNSICAENSGNDKTIQYTKANMTSVGGGTGTFIRSDQGNSTEFDSDFNVVNVTGFDNNYYAYVDTPAIANLYYDKVNAFDFTGGTGVVNLSRKIIDFLPISLTGSVVAPQVLNGANGLVIAGQTGNVSNFALNGHHAMITVNTVTPNATITFTGTSLSEFNGVPITGDTEVITVDATGDYQTSKKWAFAATTVSGTVNYDIRRLSYEDYSNIDFRVSGWVLNAISEGPASSLRFRMIGVKDLGNNKMQLNTIEDMTIDNSGITDNLRTGGDDRSVSSPVVYWANTTPTNKKSDDFNFYFVSKENVFKGSSLDEGYYFEVVSFNKVGVLNFKTIIDKI